MRKLMAIVRKAIPRLSVVKAEYLIENQQEVAEKLRRIFSIEDRYCEEPTEEERQQELVRNWGGLFIHDPTD